MEVSCVFVWRCSSCAGVWNISWWRMRSPSCLLQHLVEGKVEGSIEVTVRQGRRRKQLLDDFQETRGERKLKQGALDSISWRTRFGRGYGPVIMQTTTEWMNVIIFPQYSTLPDDGFLQKPRQVTTNYKAKYQQT